MARPGRKIRVGGEPGNPLGAPRLRLNRSFISALADDFEAFGSETIVKVRRENPREYLRMIAQLVPMQIYLGEDDSRADQQRELLDRVSECLTPEGQRIAQLRLLPDNSPKQ